MKIVLIQGNRIAAYEGRKQTVVVAVNNWDFDVREFVEDLRVRGPAAVNVDAA